MISIFGGSVFDYILILFLLITIIPIVRQKLLETQRFVKIKEMELRRHSRVILLIHREESLSFLGLPIMRYINIEDAESLLRAIRLTPVTMPIDLIIHTPGGLVLASEQIAMALSRHPAKVTVFVPHYAMSGGTLIALGADEIVMDENSVLGPLDPQIDGYPASSIMNAITHKPARRVSDRTFILADIAVKSQIQIRDAIHMLLFTNGMSEGKAKKLSDILTSGQWTHDYPITASEALSLSLPVKIGLPRYIYGLMNLFESQSNRPPSVQFIPTPYKMDEN